MSLMFPSKSNKPITQTPSNSVSSIYNEGLHKRTQTKRKAPMFKGLPLNNPIKLETKVTTLDKGTVTLNASSKAINAWECIDKIPRKGFLSIPPDDIKLYKDVLNKYTKAKHNFIKGAPIFYIEIVRFKLKDEQGYTGELGVTEGYRIHRVF